MCKSPFPCISFPNTGTLLAIWVLKGMAADPLARTKKATVEAGLRLLVDTHSQTAGRRLKGKVQWRGDLGKSRRGRVRK
jgi:hypothetical protein